MPRDETQRVSWGRGFTDLILTTACAVLWLDAGAAEPAQVPEVAGLPFIECVAQQTGGFHDYPGGEEVYEPALFHPRSFTLEENPVFMLNLVDGEGTVDLYLTLTHEVSEDSSSTVPETTELECRKVRGANAAIGYSCVNLPPSEMFLINAQTLRYTRTAVGGWTFAGATGQLSGDSIFVEYGQCTARDPLAQSSASSASTSSRMD